VSQVKVFSAEEKHTTDALNCDVLLPSIQQTNRKGSEVLEICYSEELKGWQWETKNRKENTDL